MQAIDKDQMNQGIVLDTKIDSPVLSNCYIFNTIIKESIDRYNWRLKVNTCPKTLEYFARTKDQYMRKSLRLFATNCHRKINFAFHCKEDIMGLNLSKHKENFCFSTLGLSSQTF